MARSYSILFFTIPLFNDFFLIVEKICVHS